MATMKPIPKSKDDKKASRLTHWRAWFQKVSWGVAEETWNLRGPQRTGRGCWVMSTLKRFLMVIRCREYLSSGENRAGWAEQVCCPIGSSFCSRKKENISSVQEWWENSIPGVIRETEAGMGRRLREKKKINRKTRDATVRSTSHTLLPPSLLVSGLSTSPHPPRQFGGWSQPLPHPCFSP